MFAHLSKKISISGQQNLECVEWNAYEGWIACGGGNGVLKVLKLEQSDQFVANAGNFSQAQYGSLALQNNLSANQMLFNHKSTVSMVKWNAVERRLTSSDSDGVINVWKMDQNMQWVEDMNSNRGKSVVRALSWTHDGKKICIAYEDGVVIVGDVVGNRVWRKGTKLKLTHAEWSPDDRLLLLGVDNGDIVVHDSKSSAFLNKLPNYCANSSVQETTSAHHKHQICGIHWYDGAQGYTDLKAPTLAICYRNGKCQLMRSDLDDDPILVDTGLDLKDVQWNPFGSVLAVCGSQNVTNSSTGEVKKVNQLQFYSNMGIHLRTLRIPGTNVAGLSWENTGLRLALAVDSFVYFANVRPEYKWGCFSSKTLVYSYSKIERPEHCVVFWNYKTDERFVKYVTRLIDLRTSGEHCCLLTPSDHPSLPGEKSCLLTLCNTIGSPIASKSIPLLPTTMDMTSEFVIACSESYCYLWRYSSEVTTETAASISSTESQSTQYLFHIYDRSLRPFYGNENSIPLQSASKNNDVITAIVAGVDYFVIGRESGALNFFSLDEMSYVSKQVLPLRPHRMKLNCNGTRLSVIDFNGIMTMYCVGRPGLSDAEKSHSEEYTLEKAGLERKDVWNMVWSGDDENLFATTEKTKMYTFRGTHPEEPVQSSAYLCSFRNLNVRVALIDELMMKPDNPDRDLIFKVKTKSLRDAQQILKEVGINDAYQFIKDNPHKRLWKLLAEFALHKLDFQVAHRAFVQCSDYQGVQFVKFVQGLDNRAKQLAEVCAYFKRFDEAEKIYISSDRRDLAIEMRMRIGDWFGVLNLIESGVGSGGSDEIVQRSWNQVGDFFADRQKWHKALKHYHNARNYEKLVLCYSMLEDYKSLENLIDVLPDGSTLLVSIGERLSSVGLSKEAVRAFLRAGQVQMAIDSCVELNEWDIAIMLAEENNIQETQQLLAKYANHLVEKEQLPEAVELYRRANQNTEAAKLLTTLANDAGQRDKNLIKAKMLFVLAALEVEKYKRAIIDEELSAESRETNRTVKNLLKHHTSMSSDETLRDSWRGAEAYHFLMLVQRQLQQQFFADAFFTAMRLMDYEDILDQQEVYSICALASFHAGEYGSCSKAIQRLESMDSPDSALQKAKYSDLAVEIFTRHPPKNKTSPNEYCPGCQTEVYEWDSACPGCGERFQACVASGRTLFSSLFFQCSVCKHRTHEHEMVQNETCPLCHAPV